MVQKRKNFDDLFVSVNNKLLLTTNLIIEGNEYKSGDNVADLKFPDFDLSDNPKDYFYILKGKTLWGRVPLK